MSVSAKDVYDELHLVRGELTTLLGRVNTLFAMLDDVGLVERPPFVCRCTLGFRSQESLDEHVYHSHDGPTPARWERLEGMIDGTVPVPKAKRLRPVKP